jgi:AcrR family transcriptional regulator
MRRLATRLGAAPMSLYRHVSGKDDLLGLVGTELAGRLPRPAAEAPWDERVLATLREVRRTLLPLPGATSLLSATALTSDEALDVIEGLLAALAEGGFGPVEGAEALATLWTHTLGDVMTEQAPLGGPGRDLGEERARVTEALLASGGERALLPAAAAHWSAADAGERFDHGLRALLAGLVALRGQA